MFTLSLLSASVWSVLMVLLANLLFDLSDPAARVAFYGLIAVEAASVICSTPLTLFERKVDHRRLALIVFVQFGAGTLLSLWLAWRGAGMWALVGMNLFLSLTSLVLLYLWQPIYKPRLAWKKSVQQYYFRFGGKVAVQNLVFQLLDRVDDLWSAMHLGNVAAGFYTQAHMVGRYPLKIASLPLVSVARGTFSALKYDDDPLRQSFNLVISLLTRISFLIGGGVLLAAPEFVTLYLGDKWLPMVNVLRIMVVYMMLEPLKEVLTTVFSAIGKPELGLKARLWQLAVLIPGLAIFSVLLPWGIEGVGLAASISVLTGLAVMAWQLKGHLQADWRGILLAPLGALLLAGLAELIFLRAVQFDSIWLALLAKIGLWLLFFGLAEVLLDRQFLLETWRVLQKYLIKKGGEADEQAGSAALINKAGDTD